MNWKINSFMCLTGTARLPLAEFILAEVSCVAVLFGLDRHRLAKPNWPTAGFETNEHMLSRRSQRVYFTSILFL